VRAIRCWVTPTTHKFALVRAEWLKPGLHLTAIGRPKNSGKKEPVNKTHVKGTERRVV